MLAGTQRLGAWRQTLEGHRSGTGGRNDGHRRPCGRTTDFRRHRPAGDRREPPRRQRVDRPPCHVAGGARRRHDPGRAEQLAGGIAAGDEAALRPAEGRRQHRQSGQDELCARDGCELPGQGLPGSSGPAEDAQGQVQLRQLWQRHHLALLGTDLQRPGRPRDAERGLPRLAARAAGRDRRPGRHHVRWHGDILAADQGASCASMPFPARADRGISPRCRP